MGDTVAYQEALAFLQKCSTTDGNSVFDHVSSLLAKVIEERPRDAVDIIETSLLIKKTAFQPENLNPPIKKPINAAKAVAEANLFRSPETDINPDTGEPEPLDPPNEFETENVAADSALFEAVGSGLGMQEMYRVMLTMRKLGEDPVIGVATVRFFGKFLGTHGDYYVFETTLQTPPEPPAEPEEPPTEAPPEFGEGTNGYYYFVCSWLGGPMVQLPNVTPQQIQVARQIKKFLTGDLEASVSAYPPFPGVEKNFLRAQIARISSTTVICPANFFTLAEDSETTLEKNEEFEALGSEEMLELASWSHRYPHIKKQGRCVEWFPPPPEDEEEPEEPEGEESPALLTTLDLDAEVNAAPAWTPVVSSKVPGVKYKVAGMKSNLWPGAVAVVSGTQFSNIYIGWGLKNSPFVPMPPPPVATEYDSALVESTEVPRVEGEVEENAEGEPAEEE